MPNGKTTQMLSNSLQERMVGASNSSSVESCLFGNNPVPVLGARLNLAKSFDCSLGHGGCSLSGTPPIIYDERQEGSWLEKNEMIRFCLHGNLD